MAILTMSLVAQDAFASPVDDKRRKAEAIARQIEQNGDKIAALSESYNYTRLQLSNLKTSVEETKAQIEAAKIENEKVKERVQTRAVEMYTKSSVQDDRLEDKIDDQRSDQYVEIATGNDETTINQLILTTEALNESKASLESQLSSIEEKEKALAEQKKEIESANASQKALLDQTKGELAQLVAQQQAQRQRAQSAAVVKKQTGSQTLPANLPAPSPKAALAIEYARQQLGKPYVYAAAGPNAFDCSGLTQQAWAAAGLRLPHYSGAQYAMFPKVPVSQLQPGDLVFRGPGGSQHVGLYIGNGMMIHAPQTGDVVKISPVRSSIGGSRPG